MKVLVTGASGQLGKEVIKALREYQYGVISRSHNELDITDSCQVKYILETEKPDIVVNCAAYTKVDLCESNQLLAYKVNAVGPRNLAIYCEQSGLRLVHISTDYVFDGQGKRPYREDDKISPITIYGKSKALGESYVEKFCSKHFIIRTAWLYGDGNNFVRTMLQLGKERRELDVVCDQIGTPTSTKDLVNTILELIKTEHYGLYHGTCEGNCSWYEFAKKIFSLKNMDVKVNPVTSEKFNRPAKRPNYSVLDNFMLKLVDKNLFRSWEESLEDYLKGEI